MVEAASVTDAPLAAGLAVGAATSSGTSSSAEQSTPDGEFAGLGEVETKKLAKTRAREVKAEINKWCRAFEEREGGRAPSEADRLPIHAQIGATYQVVRSVADPPAQKQKTITPPPPQKMNPITSASQPRPRLVVWNLSEKALQWRRDTKEDSNGYLPSSKPHMLTKQGIAIPTTSSTMMATRKHWCRASVSDGLEGRSRASSNLVRHVKHFSMVARNASRESLLVPTSTKVTGNTTCGTRMVTKSGRYRAVSFSSLAHVGGVWWSIASMG